MTSPRYTDRIYDNRRDPQSKLFIPLSTQYDTWSNDPLPIRPPSETLLRNSPPKPNSWSSKYQYNGTSTQEKQYTEKRIAASVFATKDRLAMYGDSTPIRDSFLSPSRSRPVNDKITDTVPRPYGSRHKSPARHQREQTVPQAPVGGPQNNYSNNSQRIHIVDGNSSAASPPPKLRNQTPVISSSSSSVSSVGSTSNTSIFSPKGPDRVYKSIWVCNLDALRVPLLLAFGIKAIIITTFEGSNRRPSVDWEDIKSHGIECTRIHWDDPKDIVDGIQLLDYYVNNRTNVLVTGTLDDGNSGLLVMAYLIGVVAMTYLEALNICAVAHPSTKLSYPLEHQLKRFEIHLKAESTTSV